MIASAMHTNAAPPTGAPDCPKCAGRMWDNRASKRSPKAPDFRCRDRTCDGVLWPGQHNVALPVSERRAYDQRETVPERQSNGDLARPLKKNVGLEFVEAYLGLTDFVLSDVRPRYQDAGMHCSDATVAAIVATLFIARCRGEGLRP